LAGGRSDRHRVLHFPRSAFLALHLLYERIQIDPLEQVDRFIRRQHDFMHRFEVFRHDRPAAIGVSAKVVRPVERVSETTALI
jgi:hypothetical protein